MKNETRRHDENAGNKSEISCNKNEISGQNKGEVSRYVKNEISCCDQEEFHVAIKVKFQDTIW